MPPSPEHMQRDTIRIRVRSRVTADRPGRYGMGGGGNRCASRTTYSTRHCTHLLSSDHAERRISETAPNEQQLVVDETIVSAVCSTE